MHFFFFFQAEDGIRDHCVTGVQTCALPISRSRVHELDMTVDEALKYIISMGVVAPRQRQLAPPRVAPPAAPQPERSEERRVGKECRSGWGAYERKKKVSEHMSIL